MKKQSKKTVTVYRGPFKGEAEVTSEEAKKEPKLTWSCLVFKPEEEKGNIQ